MGHPPNYLLIKNNKYDCGESSMLFGRIYYFGQTSGQPIQSRLWRHPEKLHRSWAIGILRLSEGRLTQRIIQHRGIQSTRKKSLTLRCDPRDSSKLFLAGAQSSWLKSWTLDFRSSKQIFCIRYDTFHEGVAQKCEKREPTLRGCQRMWVFCFLKQQ